MTLAILLITTLAHPYLVNGYPLSFIFMCFYPNCEIPYLKTSEFCYNTLQYSSDYVWVTI